MNKSLLILLLIINVTLHPSNQSSQEDNNILENEMITVNHEYYDLQIKVEKINNKNNLVVNLKPKNNSFFMSPYEEQEALGKYYMDLGSYINLSFDGCNIESPSSKKEFGPQKFPIEFGKDIKWISDETTYSQPLKLETKDDFQVFGRIKFTIEPSCTLEIIPFAIRYKNGKMSVFKPNC